MAQHDTFHLIPIGKTFTVAGWHAKEDGTSQILTKVSDTQAVDDTGRKWDFSASMGLQCFER
jgi:hypothetical protein